MKPVHDNLADLIAHERIRELARSLPDPAAIHLAAAEERQRRRRRQRAAAVLRRLADRLAPTPFPSSRPC